MAASLIDAKAYLAEIGAGYANRERKGIRGMALRPRISGVGTRRPRSPISPRPGVEGRPEVVGAVQNDEINPT